MPIEIRELEVNTQIVGDETEGAAFDEESREELIAECIDRILQLLKDKTEL